VEAESVILRDPGGRSGLRIVEQNYRADPVTSESLQHEGSTIDFFVPARDRVVNGRIVRAAVPPSGQPILEVDGKL
jgi:hypothetical protein